MTAKEQVDNAKKMFYQAMRNYIDTAKKAVVEHRGFRLMDDDSYEDGKPVRIRIRHIVPAFDQVNFNYLPNSGRTILIFHVADGDGYYSNTTWVSEDDLPEDNVMELLDYIAWDA